MAESIYIFSDEICPTCGCVIGGGCPESTNEERLDYLNRHASETDLKKVVE